MWEFAENINDGISDKKRNINFIGLISLQLVGKYSIVLLKYQSKRARGLLQSRSFDAHREILQGKIYYLDQSSSVRACS